MRSLAPRPDDEPFRLDFAPDAVGLYWVDNVAIMAWHQSPTAAVVEALHASAEPRRKRYPSGMSFVHLGRAQFSLLDGETRQVFVRLLRELDSYVAATAIVTRASGFLASTLRSIATGIVVLSRTQVEVRFHDRPEEVLDWLPERHERVTGIKLDVDRLRHVLTKAAASLDEPAGSVTFG